MKTNYLSHTAPWRHALTTTALIASFVAVSLTGYGADATKKKIKVKKDKLTFEVGSDQLTIRRNGETHQFSKDSKEYKQLLEQYERLIQQVEAPEGETLSEAKSTAERPIENESFSYRLRKTPDTKITVSDSQVPKTVERKRRTEPTNNAVRASRDQNSWRRFPFVPRVKEEKLVRSNSAPKPPQTSERAQRSADFNQFTEKQLPQSENRRARSVARSQYDRGRRSLSNVQADEQMVRQNDLRVQDEHSRALEQMQRQLREQLEQKHHQLEQKHHQLKQELERVERQKQIANENRQRAIVSELRAKESELSAKKQAGRVERLRQMLEDEGIISSDDSEVEIEFSKSGLEVNGESYPGELFEKARKIFDVDSKEDFKSNFRYRSSR